MWVYSYNDHQTDGRMDGWKDGWRRVFFPFITRWWRRQLRSGRVARAIVVPSLHRRRTFFFFFFFFKFIDSSSVWLFYSLLVCVCAVGLSFQTDNKRNNRRRRRQKNVDYFFFFWFPIRKATSPSGVNFVSPFGYLSPCTASQCKFFPLDSSSHVNEEEDEEAKGLHSIIDMHSWLLLIRYWTYTCAIEDSFSHHLFFFSSFPFRSVHRKMNRKYDSLS